jgi:diguanylate cyclase (GGDEF)-like protein/PAS domain S-box-containing protein
MRLSDLPALDHLVPDAGAALPAWGDWRWLQDTALRFIAWMPQHDDADGPTEASLLGRTLAELDPTPDATLTDLDAVLAAQRPFHDVVVRVALATGEVRHLRVSGQPTFDARGGFAGYAGIAQDTTEAVRAALRTEIEHQVTGILAAASEVDDAARRVIETVCSRLGWDCGAWWQVDDDGSTMRCSQTWGRSREVAAFLATTQRASTQSQEDSDEAPGLVRSVWLQRRPVWIRDVAAERGFHRAVAAADAGLRSAFAFPVQTSDKVLGAMEFFSRRLHPTDNALLHWSEAIAQQFAGFVQLVEARGRLDEALSRQRSLLELSSDWVWEQDEDFRFTRLEASAAVKKTLIARGWSRRTVQLGKTRWDWPALNLDEEDWARHRELLARREVFHDFEIRRPDLPDGRQFWISVSGAPYYDAQGRFKGYRGLNKDISERKNAEARIYYLATHDALTDLPNRTLFGEILNRTVLAAKRYERRFALLFIDLDRFKLVNDSLGHDAGDTLLKEVAKRLVATLRESDVIGRLGGDEFVVLLQEVDNPRDVEIVANNLLGAILRPVSLLGQECRVTASIGVGMFPEHGQDGSELMKNADVAMYAAKALGKNQFCFYDPQTLSHSLERMALESCLRHAIERDELFLQYQAKRDLKTLGVAGVEALLRWNHPQLGVVSPLKFIPLAEETGLIVPIGKWVMRTACFQNVAWQQAGWAPMCMAINLSARQFNDEHLLEDIVSALADSGMAPELLELELTESMVIQNPGRAIALLESIKKMGCRIAIDDFGTGYSSLQQLKNFPIDTLKVDRSFIRDLHDNKEDQAMTSAIIAMGKTLGLTVVAEGVETEEQQRFLGKNDCDQIQGFYFSRPLSADQVDGFLRAQESTSI